MGEIKTLMYKGKPLVRQGRFIFYGFPDDKYILFMNILDAKKVGDIEIATKVLVQIQDTYDAFDIGTIWLERALKQK